jgi:broad specificity phosphatase PhoE
MTVERVLIVRHGETDYNASGRWQGWLQTNLSEQGKRQVRLLAAYLQPLPLGAIYSSDLQRAIDTAQPIAQSHGLTVQTDQRLREIGLGIFQGLTRSEIQQTYPLEFDRWHNDHSYVVPQGESRLQLQERMFAAWQAIVNGDSGQQIVLVSHGGAIRWLLLKLFSPEAIAGKSIENTSITTLERVDETWRLVEFSATPHLRD